MTGVDSDFEAPDYGGRAFEIGNADWPVPSYLASEYRRPAFRPYPSTWGAWALLGVGVLLTPLIFLGMWRGAKAARAGNWVGWVVVVAGLLQAALMATLWWAAA